MRKHLLVLAAMAIVLSLVLAPNAFARLGLISPQGIIERSTLIVDATVLGPAPGKRHKPYDTVYAYKVNAVLKGATKSSTISVGDGFYQGAPSHRGSRVLMFLTKIPEKLLTRQDPDYAFTGDVNSYAYIENGQIANSGGFTNDNSLHVRAVYNAFYQEKMRQRAVELKRIEKRKQEAMNARRRIQQRSALITLGAVVLIGALILLTKRNRTRKPSAAQ